MNTYSWLEVFVASMLDAATPPSSPFKDTSWGGFAFDRNRHEDFAPDYIWLSWLKAHIAINGDLPLIAYSRATSHGGARSIFIKPSLDSLRCYWSTDYQFLSDHYIVDPFRRWIVRLDQDVTLFGGQRSFVQRVCDIGGGIDRIRKDMIKDFDPDPEDSAGLRRYIGSISQGLT